MINRKYDIPPVEIRIALVRAGITQTEIAKKVGVYPSVVCRVIDNLTGSDKVRRAIAAAIGIDIKRVWPSIYLDGEPRKPGRPKIKSSFTL